MNSQTAYLKVTWEMAEYGKTMRLIGFLDGINVAEKFLFWLQHTPDATQKDIRQWLLKQIKAAHAESKVLTRPAKQARLE